MPPLFFIVGIVNGGYEATQLRISMENSPGILSGTVFNLYASMSNIGQIALGATLIGLIASLTSFQIGWQSAWIFLLLALPIGLILARRIEKPKE